MSAYRRLPAPPRWRVVYRPSIALRIRQRALIIGFWALFCAGPLAALVVSLFSHRDAAVLAILAFPVSLTAGVFLMITWMTRRPEVATFSVDRLLAEKGPASQCRVFTEGERWTLPLRAGNLRVGQTLRVRFQAVAPQGGAEPGREVIEVCVAEE